MGTIAILSDSENARALYLETKELPDNYMGDFTITGLLVDNYNEAIAILETAGLTIKHIKTEAGDLTIEHSGQLEEITELLSSKNITYCYSDIADTIYQA